MADPQSFIWKGPATSVEVWPADAPDATSAKPAEPLISERVTPGRPLSVALDPQHPTIKGWLAFGLVEANPAASAQDAPAAGEVAAALEPSNRKERRNG